MAGVSVTPGVLLVDKPRGLTSHDVISRLRRAFGTRRVGHAGTLDPMATGLLLIGVESATKLLTYLVGLDKEYLATIRLGHATTTDDAEGEALPGADASGVSNARIAAAIAGLTGTIQQIPSAVSAIKVDGVRAYRRVREGETVELAAREVTVAAFEILGRSEAGLPAGCVELSVRVEVSSGTYVRALARDLGEALGVGGHLTALRRTRVGPFTLEGAVPVAAEGQVEPDLVRAALRTPAEVAETLFPTIRVDADALRDLAHGRSLRLDHPDTPVLAVLGPDGRLGGLVELRSGRSRVLYNLPTEEVLG